ncbi:MAG: folate-binding protein, partial [Alphaproteobacteria bacterium]
LIRISGLDRRKFLQGLISNDINLLDRQPCVYACLLNAQGKFLHDFFITEKNDTLLLDCEGDARSEDLFRRLSMYKLRAEVILQCEKEIDVYAISEFQNLGISESQNKKFGDSEILKFGYSDPRHPALGFRTFEKPTDLPEKPFEEWDSLRISLCVPDGSRDMIPEKSTLLECNIDKLNGISWDKGCYTGQELTARMHYRGLAKKHLYAVRIESPNLNSEIRSSCGDIGIALLKDEKANDRDLSTHGLALL